MKARMMADYSESPKDFEMAKNSAARSANALGSQLVVLKVSHSEYQMVDMLVRQLAHHLELKMVAGSGLYLVICLASLKAEKLEDY
jgi:hypothetical protein